MEGSSGIGLPPDAENDIVGPGRAPAYGQKERTMDEQNGSPRELNRHTAWLLRNVGTAMYEALNGSLAAAEILNRRLEKADRGEEREFLAIMRHDQHKLLRIADNLTLLGSIALGEASAGENAEDLNEICDTLLHTLSTMLPGADIRFEACRDTCAVTGSANNIESLILNLLAYSLERCRDGGSILLRTERKGETVYLILRDDCANAPEQSLDALYSALERDPLRVQDRGGAGLGLLTAESIARLLGGSLMLSEEPGQGMEAVVSLPRCRTAILRLRQPGYGNRLRGVLTILSDLLSRDKYMSPYL